MRTLYLMPWADLPTEGKLYPSDGAFRGKRDDAANGEDLIVCLIANASDTTVSPRDSRPRIQDRAR